MIAEAPVESVAVPEPEEKHAKIDALEAEIMRLPRPDIQIVHHFAPGIYAREMRAPAGSVITGKIHKTRHLNIVSAGRLTVYNELGDLREIVAPYAFVSEPGTRRAAIVVENVVWTTIHPNPDGENDPDKLEALLVENRQNPLIQGMVQPTLRENRRWLPIVGYEGLYEVSDHGDVRSLNFGHMGFVKELKTGESRGYKSVELFRNGESRRYTVHRLVAAAFIGPRPDGYDINHKSGDRADNRLENLEYCTRSENQAHSYRVLGKKAPSGVRHWKHKLTECDVADIKARCHSGETQSSIAKIYGIDQSVVSNIKRRKVWKHVGGQIK